MESNRPPQAQVQVTTDIVAFTVEDNLLKVLLIKRAEEPFVDRWALPGGFLWEGEDTQQAAQRILLDKAGVADVYIEQLYTFDDPERDPRGQVMSVTYFALVARNDLVIKSTIGTQDPMLFPVDDLPQLAFDHNRVVGYALDRLKAKIQYTNAVYSLLPENFTFNQLQHIYEVILGEPVDRRNFRKKFMSLGLIKPLGEHTSGGRHRPAELFSFVSRQPANLERWF